MLIFDCPLQNDISDILDLTFSIDADEEKLILYERAQVCTLLGCYVLIFCDFFYVIFG